MEEDVVVRVGPRPGDLGTVLTMHGEIYAREYGFDAEFESHVAHGLADFAAAYAARGEEAGRLWLAESGGNVVGTVALTDEGDGLAQLRWFLVAPEARGGLGRRLLDLLLARARQGGYQRIQLWTVDILPAAAKLYASVGFREVQRHRVRQWGHRLDEVRHLLEL